MGKGEKIGSSMIELQQVEQYFITRPEGLIGSVIGRWLKFRMNRFFFHYVEESGQKKLRKVRVDLSSLEAMSEVYPNMFDRAHLPVATRQKLNVRAARHLRSDLYPYAEFTVEEETDKTISGSLNLHGKTNPVTCTKEFAPGQLVVKCPVDMRKFLIDQPKHLRGFLATGSEVTVITKVPTKLLS